MLFLLRPPRVRWYDTPHSEGTPTISNKNSRIAINKQANIIPRPEHTVSRNEISNSALKVLYRLNKAGYQAFLVGGCVRDALLDLHPKDFDVATDALPEQVKALFGNCRLIGRRFRLAHVRFGPEIIEVATFRASANERDSEEDSSHDIEGRILRDNVYGTVDEDVWRRDFTCNALYYNIADFSIWDYTDGIRDIKRRRLVLIGDPETRLREDPVRMLRAVRFAAKLNFEIDESIEKIMPDVVELLANVPAARLFDEFLKMFQVGHAASTYRLLRRYDLFSQLFPETDAAISRNPSLASFVELALASTDRRINAGKSVTPMFLIGVFLWEPIRVLAEQMSAREKMSDSHAISSAAYEIVAAQQARLSIPRRFTAPMREMLALQPRFQHTKGRRALRLLEHKRFRAAYDFMMLLAEVGVIPAEVAQFWTDVQTQNADQRYTSFNVHEGGGGRKPRRRPRKRRGKRKTSGSPQ